MSNKTLKDFVIDYCKEVGHDYDTKEQLWEVFEDEIGVIVWEGKPDHHRWYNNYDCVYKVIIEGKDRFFSWYWVEIKSESSDRDDVGWVDPDLNDLSEVYQKEVISVKYVTKEKL